MADGARLKPTPIFSSLAALTIGLSAFTTSALADSGVTPVGSPVTAIANAANSDNASEMASDAAGNFVVAAECISGTGAAVCAQLFQAGGTPVGAPFFAVNSVPENISFSVAMNGAGEFAIAWSDISTSGMGDRAGHIQRFTADGTPKGGPIDMPTTNAVFGSRVSALGMDASGNLAVVWLTAWGSHPVEGESLHAAVYSPSNVLRGSARVLDSSIQFQTGKYSSAGSEIGGISLAMDAAGDFVVAWSKRDVGTGAGHIFGQRYAATGAPRGFRFAIEDFASAVPDTVRVAMNASGAFTATWLESAIADSGIVTFRQFNRQGVAAAAAQTAATYCNAILTASSDIAMDAGGSFIVVWAGSAPAGSCDGGVSHVYAQRYDLEGQPLGTSFIVDSGSEQSVELNFPRATMASSGANFTITWNQADQFGISVLAQPFSVP